MDYFHTSDHFDSMRISPTANEFQSDEYYAYRKLVLDELEAEKSEKNKLDISSFAKTRSQKIDLKLDCLEINSDLMRNDSPLTPQWDDALGLDISNHIVAEPLHQEAEPLVQLQTQSENIGDGLLLDLNSPETPGGRNWSEYARQLDEQHTQMKQATEIKRKSSLNRQSSWKQSQKQKNDRESIRQKLAMDDFDDEKPCWSQRRLDRTLSANNQNLQICYINDENTSSEEEDTSTVLPSPSFGRNKVFHPGLASSSSSTISLASASSLQTPDTSEVITLKHDGGSVLERMEYDARIALTQAHEAARIQAHVERLKRLRHNANAAINEDIRTKVRLRALKRNDCQRLSVGQLHVVLNDLHRQKEEMNQQLVQLLITRDDLKTEQDAKLMDVEDAKSLMLVTGPETTV